MDCKHTNNCGMQKQPQSLLIAVQSIYVNESSMKAVLYKYIHWTINLSKTVTILLQYMFLKSLHQFFHMAMYMAFL